MAEVDIQKTIEQIDDIELKDRSQVYTRKYGSNKAIHTILSFLTVAYAAFLVVSVLTLYWSPYQQLAIAYLGGLVLTFLVVPASKKNPRSVIGYVYDAALSLGAIVSGLYVYLDYEEFVWRIGASNQWDIILGTVAVLLVLEASRRTVGWAMPGIMAVAFAYVYWGEYFPGVWRHGGQPFERIIENQFLSVQGIFGLPMNVFVHFVFLFMVFGAVMEFVGASKFFTDISVSIAGRFAGGPAKVAVLSSGLFGSLSGSAVANVAGTGAFTIPLMKKTGFQPHVAGAVEAAASTGGQIMPPVMGAVAFMMADLLEISYGEVALAALVPAVLYFLSVGLAVHFMAKQQGMKGAPPELIRPAGEVLRQGWFYALPLIIISVVLVMGYSATEAAKWGLLSTLGLGLMARGFVTGVPMTVFLLALGWFFPASGDEAVLVTLGKSLAPAVILGLVVAVFGAKQRAELMDHVRSTGSWLWQALEKSTLTATATIGAVACAGIITGLFLSSGLGLRIAELIVEAAGGNLLLTLVLAAGLSLIFGMGVPTLVAYILVAVMVAPGVIKLGVPPLAAHLFLAYFGIFAMVTPPVCMAAFTGAAIADADMWKTGLKAFRLSLAGFLIPFIFVFEPALALMGTPMEVASAVVSALIGTVALAAGSADFLAADNNWFDRIALYGAAFMLIWPGLVTDAAGLGLLLVVYFTQKRRADAGARVAM